MKTFGHGHSSIAPFGLTAFNTAKICCVFLVGSTAEDAVMIILRNEPLSDDKKILLGRTINLMIFCRKGRSQRQVDVAPKVTSAVDEAERVEATKQTGCGILKIKKLPL